MSTFAIRYKNDPEFRQKHIDYMNEKIKCEACNTDILKNKTAANVTKGFKKIYEKNKILKLPITITVDSGSEFKGETKKYFNSKGVQIHVALPGRHRQVGMVEAKNRVIGKTLFKRMVEQELLTGVISKEWIEDLPLVIADINKRAKPRYQNVPDHFICQGDSCKILSLGTKVRVILDEPRGTTEKEEELPGKFRATDIRWHIKPSTITNVIFIPGRPPLYEVDNNENVMYTKNQLQVYDPNELPPNPSVLRGNVTTFKVDKIIAKKKEKGKTYYLVRWFGFDATHDTWEPAEELKEDVPELVKMFEQKSKLKLKLK